MVIRISLSLPTQTKYKVSKVAKKSTCLPHGGKQQTTSRLPYSERESPSVVSTSLQPRVRYGPRNSPGQNTGVGRLSLPQGIIPTEGLNPGLSHCRQILYHLSQQERPRKLECIAYPFLQEISPTEASNWAVLHCRGTLYQLNYQRSPKQWTRQLVYPFSAGPLMFIAV